jgi:hypothetical protein
MSTSNKAIQCHRHCREWGGERSEPVTPPHSPIGGAHADAHLKACVLPRQRE